MPIDDGVFTPRQFPLDPFQPTAHHEPWYIDADSLPDEDFLALQTKVILVLGEPPLQALAPLLHSPHLASSLLILATARPYSPELPPSFLPSLRVLKLSAPLSTSDNPAARLVSVFQWADRVATAWRAHPSAPQFQELTEDAPIAPALPSKAHAAADANARRASRLSWFGSVSAQSSPASSDIGLNTPRSLSRMSVASKKSLSGLGGGGSSTSLSGLATPPLGMGETGSSGKSTYAFDALFNFLPPDASDRPLLKFAILVTTVSRPFLTPSPYISIRTGSDPRGNKIKKPSTPPISISSTKQSRRISFRSRSSSAPTLSSPSPPPLPSQSQSRTRTQLIHLVPPPRIALLKPLESFLVSYTYPATPPAPGLPPMHLPTHHSYAHSHGSGKSHYQAPTPPKPFIMPPIALGDMIMLPSTSSSNPSASGSRQWSLVELVLCGAVGGEQEGGATAEDGLGAESEKGGATLAVAGEFGKRASVIMRQQQMLRAKLEGAGDVWVRGGGRRQEKRRSAGSALSSGNSSSSLSAMAPTNLGYLTAKNAPGQAYPTPPSSQASSPSVSPGPGLGTVEGLKKAGGVMLTPSGSDTSEESVDGSSADGSRSGRKKRGFFKWVTRK